MTNLQTLPAQPGEEARLKFSMGTPFEMLCGTSDINLASELRCWKPEVNPATTWNAQDRKRLAVLPRSHLAVRLFRPPLVEHLYDAICTDAPTVRFDVLCLGHDDDDKPLRPWLLELVPPGTCNWETGCRIATASYEILKDAGLDDVHCLVLESTADTLRPVLAVSDDAGQQGKTPNRYASLQQLMAAFSSFS